MRDSCGSEKTLHLVMCSWRDRAIVQCMQVREMETYSRHNPLLLSLSTSQESQSAGRQNFLRGAPLVGKLLAILDFVFGCHHPNLSRVFTLSGRTYRVCCGCGAKFEYSLRGMCIERRMSVLDAQFLSL
jgi:hypothetical protein